MKIFANDISNKGLISKINEKLIQVYTNNNNNIIIIIKFQLKIGKGKNIKKKFF